MTNELQQFLVINVGDKCSLLLQFSTTTSVSAWSESAAGMDAEDDDGDELVSASAEPPNTLLTSMPRPLTARSILAYIMSLL